MDRQDAFVYVNGDNKIGSGHFLRCLNIAGELGKYSIRIHFLHSFLSPVLQQVLMQNNYAAYKLKQIQPCNFIQIVTAHQDKGNHPFLIIDSDNVSFYKKEFQLELIDAGFKLMMITVNADFHYYAHLLLNQNIISLYQDYKTESYTRKLFGPEYFIYGQAFRKRGMQPVKDLGKNIFIAFGSADPCSYTVQLLERIVNGISLNNFKFHVVVGPLNTDLKKIQQLCNFYPESFHLYSNVSDISPIMLQCNLAVCSPGLTFWELALMGVRSILFSSSLREKQIAAFLHEKGFAYTLHHFNDTFDAFKFEEFERALMNLNAKDFYNFSLLREKLNPEGIVKIAEEVNRFLSDQITIE